MALAIAIFGTPDGFDGISTGAKGIATRDTLNKFEKLGFSSLSLPLGKRAWGFFKKPTDTGPIIAVCQLVRAIEYSAVRTGGYLGVGVLLQGDTVPALDLVTALKEFMDQAEASFFANDLYRFVAKGLDEVETNTPQSCKNLASKLIRAPETSSFATRAIANTCFAGGVTDIIRSLLGGHHAFQELAVLISDDTEVISSAQISGLTVERIETLNDWIAVSLDEIKQFEEKKAAAVAREAALAQVRQQEAERLAIEKATIQAARQPSRYRRGPSISRQSSGPYDSPESQYSTSDRNNEIIFYALAAGVLCAILASLVTYILMSDKEEMAKYAVNKAKVIELRDENKTLREELQGTMLEGDRLRQQLKSTQQANALGSNPDQIGAKEARPATKKASR